MKETVERLCQRIVAARGYLVVGPAHPCDLGVTEIPIFGEGTCGDGLLYQKTVVISETTAEDFKQQAVFAGRCLPPNFWNRTRYFYRVIAE